MVDDALIRSMADLAEIACPALVLATEADLLHPVEMAQQIASALPNALFEMTPARYLEPEAHVARVRALVERFRRV